MNMSVLLKKYLNEVSNDDLLTRQEESWLFNKLANGDAAARKILIKANLRLVITIAMKYSNANTQVLDLIQEGNCGLIKAVDNFDYNRGVKFSTYAVPCIQRYIHKFVTSTSRSRRIPEYVAARCSKINQEIQKYYSANHNRPTMEQLAESTNFSQEDIALYTQACKTDISLCTTPSDNITADKILSYISCNKLPNVNTDDNQNNNPSDNYTTTEFCNALTEGMEVLSDLEQYIIKNYFGLDDLDALNYRELGEVLNVSKVYVHNVAKKALKKLKKSLSKKGFGCLAEVIQ